MDIFDIGDRVKAERRRLGLTQEALGAKAGLSRTRINHLERGAAHDMKFGSVISVLNALNLDMRLTDFNAGRPTMEDLLEERDAPEEDDVPSP